MADNQQLRHLIWETLPLGGSARLVMLLIAEYANTDGTGAELHHAFIARCCRISECQAGRIVRSLVNAGWLVLEAKSRRHTPHRYGINVDKLVGLQEGSDAPSHCTGATPMATSPGMDANPSGARRSMDADSNSPSPGMGATSRSLSPGMGATSRASSPSVDAASKSGAYKEARAPARSGFKLNTTTASNSTVQLLTRVGSEQEGGKTRHFGLAEAIELLVAQGVPGPFLRQQEDRAMVLDWIQDGATEHQIRLACQRARESKTDGKPIGPRYIAPVLFAVREEEKRRNANPQQFDGVDYHAGAWSRRAAANGRALVALRNASESDPD